MQEVPFVAVLDCFDETEDAHLCVGFGKFPVLDHLQEKVGADGVLEDEDDVAPVLVDVEKLDDVGLLVGTGARLQLS